MARRRGERAYLPLAFGALIRYSERERELLRLKPEHVVWGVILLIIVELLLRMMF